MPSTGTGFDSVEIRHLAEKYLAELTAFGRSASTLEKYARVFRHFATFLQERLGCDDIRLVGEHQIKDYAETVMNFEADSDYKGNWLSRLKSLFSWAENNHLILHDPTKRLKKIAQKKRKHPPYLSKEEVAKFLDSIATDTSEGLRDRALLELMYSSGLRSFEVRRLDIKDISWQERTITVIRGKGRKDRVVPLGRVALYWLDLYLQKVRGVNRSGPLFYNLTSGKPMARYYVRDIFAKHKAAAQIKKRCSPSTFRHSFAIHLLEGGAGIRQIGEMMGHVKLRTTQIYTQIIPKELKRVHHLAHPGERRRGELRPLDPKQFLRMKKK